MRSPAFVAGGGQPPTSRPIDHRNFRTRAKTRHPRGQQTADMNMAFKEQNKVFHRQNIRRLLSVVRRRRCLYSNKHIDIPLYWWYICKAFKSTQLLAFCIG